MKIIVSVFALLFATPAFAQAPMCFGGYDQFGFAKPPVPCPKPPPPPAPVCYKTSNTGLLVQIPCP